MSANFEELEASVGEYSTHLVPRPKSRFPRFGELPEEIRSMIWEIILQQLQFVELRGFITLRATPPSLLQDPQAYEGLINGNAYWNMKFDISRKHHESRLALSKAFFCHESATYVEVRLKSRSKLLENDDPIFFCPNFLNLCINTPGEPFKRACVQVIPQVENLAIYAEKYFTSTSHLIDILRQFRDLQTLYLVLDLDEAIGTKTSNDTGFIKAPSLPQPHGHFDEREAILKLYEAAVRMRARISGVLGKEIKTMQWERPDQQELLS